MEGSTGQYSDIELLFIEEVLDQHGEYIVDLLHDDISAKKLRIEDNLLDSLEYRTRKSGNNPMLEISFFGYGRAIEIRWHKRSQNTKKWAKTNTNQTIWNAKSKNRSWKNTRWYSKNVYGSLNRLIAVLSNEYTQKEQTRLKQILQRRHNETINL